MTWEGADMTGQDDQLTPSMRTAEPIWIRLSAYQRHLEEAVTFWRAEACFWRGLFFAAAVFAVGALVAIVLLVRGLE